MIIIAGSNTPFILMYMKGMQQIAFMALFQGLMAVGTVYKLFLLNKYPWFSLCFYLMIGWLGLVTANHVYEFIPTDYKNDEIMYNLPSGIFG